MVEASGIDFSDVVAAISEDYSTYENKVNQDNCKVYIKDVASYAKIKAEGTIKGDYTVEKLADIQIDINKRKQFQDNIKKIEVLEQISPNSDVIYVEIGFPFPFENRDVVTHRVYVNNKKNPELVEKYGLPKKDNEYAIILSKSVTRVDKGAIKGKTRGDVKMNYWMFEQDATDPKTFRISFCNATDMKLSVSSSMKGTIAKNTSKDISEKFAETYKKVYK